LDSGYHGCVRLGVNKTCKSIYIISRKEF
jgi:hypothetical protein